MALIIADDDWDVGIPEARVLRLPGNLYNILCGIDPLAPELAKILDLRVLGNVQGKYKVYRFRDLYLEHSGNIVLFVRDWVVNQKYLVTHPLFESARKSQMDNTFSYFAFRVPDERKDILSKPPGFDPHFRFGQAMGKLMKGELPKEKEDMLRPLMEELEELSKE